MDRTETSLSFQGSLINLPVEVLLYIVSFLSTRDIARIRLVSKSLRSISEIPSLWEVFIWSHYAPRDDKLLKHLLRTFGKHIRRFNFTDHIAPSKLQLMLRMCKNVMHLSLPSFTYVANFDKFEMTVCKLGSLQILVIQSPMYTNDFQRILKLSSNLKELSLHHSKLIGWLSNQMKERLEEWANFNYLPRKLNIIVRSKPIMMHTLISSLQSCFSTLKDKKLPNISGAPNIGWFNICFDTTSGFSPVVPYIQVRITGSSVALRSVKASKYGLLGLDMDLLHLTQGNHHGKQVYKALLIGDIDEYIDTSVTSLTSVTYFDASCCSSLYKSLYPGHLEQLSVACPNLQRLDLCGNSECLNNLQGLHSLANNCKCLQALNLLSILVSDREYDCLQLWEILCIMKLTELAIEAWMISIWDSRNSNLPPLSSRDSSVVIKRQKLIDMFKNYSSLISLQVLEVDIDAEDIDYWSRNGISDNELLLVSHFPSVTSYRLCNLPNNNCYHTLKCIFGCKYLRCLFLSKSLPGILSLSLEGHCSSLQQLYIYSRDTVLTKTFTDALCAHGALEHVILCVKSLTAASISDIIEHSYDLVTFDITLFSKVFTKAQKKQLIAALKMKFSKRKLFNGGSFAIRQAGLDAIRHDFTQAYVNNNSLLHKTDLLSVWDSNEMY